LLIQSGANTSHKNKNGSNFYDYSFGETKEYIENKYPHIIQANKYNL